MAMNSCKRVFVSLSLAVLLATAWASPASAVICPPASHCPGGGGSSDSDSSTTASVAQTAATANVGMLSSQISGMSGGGSGGGGGATGGAGGIGDGSGGRSSGNGPEGIGIWALGGANYLESYKGDGHFDGSLFNGMVGVDKQLGKLLLGLGLGVERLNLTTKYNLGKMEYEGVSVVPYMSYSITGDLIADASFSYTWLDYTMRDTQSGVKYHDDMDAYRMVTAANLTKYYMLDKLILSGRVGTLYLNEQQGDYVLNSSYISSSRVYSWQGSLAARAMYDLGQWRPSAGLTYMYDFIKSGGKRDDVWGVDCDLGLTYAPSNSLSLGLTTVVGVREKLAKLGAMLNVRYDF